MDTQAEKMILNIKEIAEKKNISLRKVMYDYDANEIFHIFADLFEYPSFQDARQHARSRVLADLNDETEVSEYHKPYEHYAQLCSSEKWVGKCPVDNVRTFMSIYANQMLREDFWADLLVLFLLVKTTKLALLVVDENHDFLYMLNYNSATSTDMKLCILSAKKASSIRFTLLQQNGKSSIPFDTDCWLYEEIVALTDGKTPEDLLPSLDVISKITLRASSKRLDKPLPEDLDTELNIEKMVIDEAQKKVRNPKTGRMVVVGSATYKKLKKENIL